jgi:isohexenylglutaconyl-CoA hydratase
MSYETLGSRAEGGVLHLTLNRPEVRNAMTLGMVIELREALAGAERDGRTRVIVLRGAQGHFSAGADIREMAGARMRLAADPDAIVKVNAAFGELCADYAQTGLALVAVLEGTVMGGGFGLACVADVAIAGESALFRLPETSLGVVPAQIAPYLVERLGYAQAHEVHSSQTLDAALQRVLDEILHNAPGAVAATKALIAKARFHAPASLVQHAAQLFSQASLSPEGVEGMSAFLQKRKAHWMPQ